MSRSSVILMGLTVLLVLIGCVLYVVGYVGWGQLLWVLASGSAGAGVTLLLEER